MDFDRLESVKKLGLTTPRVHRMANTYSVTSEVQDRLFLFPQELAGIEYLDRPHKSVLLRFRRDTLANSTAYHDPNYPMNESAPWRVVREAYSFSVDAAIPPADLQACTYAKREPGHAKWLTNWVPLNQVKDSTKLFAKGRFFDPSDEDTPCIL